MKVQVFVVIVAVAVLTSVALAWPGRPASPPPKTGTAGAPPPAWVETKTKSAWLAYGSYCWKTSCVDMIPPESRPGLPVFTVARGSTVRIHLGFAARSASLSVDKKAIRAKLDPMKHIVSWSANRGGILTAFARASGDASYVMRLHIR